MPCKFVVRLARRCAGCSATCWALTVLPRFSNPSGAGCAEIDLMEANAHAFIATAHAKSDGAGKGNGLGGSAGAAFSTIEYGIGGSIIDTRRPFRVRAYFAATNAVLHRIEITLSQADESNSIQFSIADPSYLQGLTEAVSSGMTVAMSYWSAWDMGFMDAGPCEKDDQSTCGSSVEFSDVSISDGDIDSLEPPSSSPSLPPQPSSPCIEPPAPRCPASPASPSSPPQLPQFSLLQDVESRTQSSGNELSYQQFGGDGISTPPDRLSSTSQVRVVASSEDDADLPFGLEAAIQWGLNHAPKGQDAWLALLDPTIKGVCIVSAFCVIHGWLKQRSSSISRSVNQRHRTARADFRSLPTGVAAEYA